MHNSRIVFFQQHIWDDIDVFDIFTYLNSTLIVDTFLPQELTVILMALADQQ